MDHDELLRIAGSDAPLPDDPHLAALIEAKRDRWDAAHGIVQDLEDTDAAWIHAYLHRVEGDLENAGYWYRKAGRPVQGGPLDTEWSHIAMALTLRNH